MSIKIRCRVADYERGVLDTSIVIDIADLPREALPKESAITALTLAELTAGPLSSVDPLERSKRMERLQWAEATFEAIPFDASAARAYGRIYSAAINAKQKPRGSRAVDLLIAATALSRGLPLFTRNPKDFESVSHLMRIVAV